MKKILLIFGLFLIILSCSSSDEGPLLNSSSFYKGAQTNADLSLLNQYWSIYEVKFEDRTADVPLSYLDCDRDFFTFEDNGIYKEYIIPSSDCIPLEQSLNWNFNNGVITLTNSFLDFNEIVILQLNSQQFIFKVKFDADGDGEEDIFEFLARPYVPDESNFYNNIIEWDESTTNKIRLEWSEYKGINSFVRYEIHQSVENCNPANTTLIASINDVQTTFFEDDNPPEAQQICYFLKVFTDKGFLFQSYAASISTEFLDVPGVELQNPDVANNSVTLTWDKYEGLYFSHYQVVVKNFIDGYAQGNQEVVLSEIFNVDELSFIDNSPPLLKNPVYEIIVYNKFGKQSVYNPQGIQTVREAIYKPSRVIDILDITKFENDPDESNIYLFGSIENIYEKKLVRYNYNINEIQAISNIELNFGSNKRMKLIKTNNNKELLFLGNNRLLVFNAQTLEYKYDLKTNEISKIDDFVYLQNDIYLLANDEFVYTVKRDFSNITLIDNQKHYEASQNMNNYLYHVINISNSKILIGNASESTSIVFQVDILGNISDKEEINIPITSTFQTKSFYNITNNTLINFNENRIHSLTDFSISSFEQPLFPNALVADGTQIMGSNNDSEWYVDDSSLHQKQVNSLTINTNSFEVIETEGYSHIIFENSFGDIFSLSTFFKRDEPSTSYDRPDFFIEKIK